MNSMYSFDQIFLQIIVANENYLITDFYREIKLYL